jgi:WD40 repeat protein
LLAFGATFEDLTGLVRVIDVDTRIEVYRKVVIQPVGAVAFDAEGRRLALSSGRRVIVADVKTGRVVYRTEVKNLANALALNKDATRLALATSVAGVTGFVQVVDLATHRTLYDADFRRPVNELGFSATGKRLAIGGDFTASRIAGGGEVLLVDLETAREVYRCEYQNPISALALDENGRRLTVATERDSALVLDVEASDEVRHIEYDAEVTAIGVDSEGKRLAVGFHDKVLVVELTTGRELYRREIQPQVTAVALDPHGRILVIGSGSVGRGEVVFVDVETSQVLDERKLAHPVSALAFDADGQHLAIGGGSLRLSGSRIGGGAGFLDLGGRPGGEASVIETRTRNELLKVPTGWPVTSVALSPDGQYVGIAGGFIVAGVGVNGVAVVMNVKKSETVYGKKFERLVYAVSVGANAARLAFAGGGGVGGKGWLFVTNAREYQTAFDRPVSTLALHPRGDLLMLGLSEDVHILAASDGASVGRRRVAVQHATFTTDGEKLVTAGGSTVRIFPGRPEAVIDLLCASRIARNFSSLEWRGYLGPDRWRETCHGWETPAN